jgi:hypothetical protein
MAYCSLVSVSGAMYASRSLLQKYCVLPAYSFEYTMVVALRCGDACSYHFSGYMLLRLPTLRSANVSAVLAADGTQFHFSDTVVVREALPFISSK